MRTRLQTPLLMALTCLIVGCGQNGKISDDDAIRKLMQKRVSAANAGDVEAWTNLFTNDAVIMPANRPTIIGREAIREWEQAIVDGFEGEGVLTPEEIVISGNWAFVRTSSEGTFTPRNGGRPLQIRGKDLVILRRAGGGWRIARLIGNSNSPPPGMGNKLP